MKKLNYGFTFLIACWAFLPGSTEILTHQESIKRALKNNLQIQIARNNARIASRNAHIGNAGLLPNLDLVSTYSHQKNSSGNNEDESISSTGAQIQASYTLFDGLGNLSKWKMLQASNRLGKLDARNLIEQILLDVSDAYFSAALAYEQMKIAEEMVNISRERWKRARKRADYGQATTIDVLAARVDFAADQVTLTSARFQWDESRRNLNLLLNQEVDRRFQIETRVNFREDFGLGNLISDALANNASYLTAREHLNQKVLNVRIAGAAFYPRLDLTASYGIIQVSDGWRIAMNDPLESFTIGLNLKLNLFDGLNTVTEKAIAGIELKNQQLLVDDQMKNLTKKVISTFESYQYTLQVLALEQKVVESAELNFKRTQELYNLGQVNTTQFREAQINLIRSRSNVSAAKFEAKLKEIELLQITGRLESDFNPVSH